MIVRAEKRAVRIRSIEASVPWDLVYHFSVPDKVCALSRAKGHISYLGGYRTGKTEAFVQPMAVSSGVRT